MVVRSLPELPARGYSVDELEALYALGRHYIEIGKFFSAKNIFSGLIVVAPDFIKGWLGMAVTALLNGNLNEASGAVRQLLRADPASLIGQLLLINVQLAQKDFNSAGTALGEISELLESGSSVSPNLSRIYKSLLVRFEHKR